MPNWIDWRVRKPRDSLVYCNKYNARRSWQICHQSSKSLCDNKKS